MVQIRRLTPTVEIAQPRRTSGKGYRGLRAASLVRRVKDHPSPTPQPTPCRLWQGALDNHGYGAWHRYEPGTRGRGSTGRRKIRPHRWVIEQIHGPLHPDQVVMHLCDNPLCYRYDHLRIGTIAENNADMQAKGRGRNGATYGRDQQIRAMVSSGMTRLEVATAMELSPRTVYITARGIPQQRWRARDPAPRAAIRDAIKAQLSTAPGAAADAIKAQLSTAPGAAAGDRLERTPPCQEEDQDDARTDVPRRTEPHCSPYVPTNHAPRGRDGVRAALAGMGAGGHDDRAERVPSDPLGGSEWIPRHRMWPGGTQDRRLATDDHRVPSVLDPDVTEPPC
jgi:hypothetical protein